MGRKRPSRGRQFYRPPTTIPGVPQRTCDALDRLDEFELSAASVKEALDRWYCYTRIPTGQRRLEKDPSDEDAGERARTTLDAAVAALEEREARPLRRLIAAMDERFLATTVPDPSVPATRPWWQRRDWF
ncbi:hypothetical protein [Pseudonocardia sp. NPDC046786]|uniref:hypothetical protein n=1 Tax=Pseudonocardia sp. NPDC046786 TaxID=3155471 RepID=UPI00340C8C24